MQRRTQRRSSGPVALPAEVTRPTGRRVPQTECAGFSLRGSGREVNQDRYAAEPTVLLVADGVGARAGGQYAAERVTRDACRCARSIGLLMRRGGSLVAEGVDALRDVPVICQGALRAEAARQPELAGMACTLTLALVVWPDAWIVHAGDSRGYLFRDGELRLLTADQTLASVLVESGALSTAEADVSSLRNVLTSCVSSGDENVDAIVRHVRLRQADTLLLCTDGVHGALDGRAMSEILESASSAAAAAPSLVHAAREAGATDDATVVVARFDYR